MLIVIVHWLFESQYDVSLYSRSNQPVRLKSYENAPLGMIKDISKRLRRNRQQIDFGEAANFFFFYLEE